MTRLYYDLHIHSCLSPCAEDDMTPGNIIGMASVKGLDIVALTDHNSCLNLPSFMNFAKKFNIIAIPGIELCTIEDVHVLGLFPTLEDAMEFDEYIYNKLFDFRNERKIIGNQYICDDNDDIVDIEEKLLLNAAIITINEAYDRIKEHNGVMIPAHVDKPANSLLSNLGFVPSNSKFTCVEIKFKERQDEIIKKNPYLKTCNIIYNSDAHNLSDINEAKYYIEVENVTIPEILKAINNY